ncbi:hypothetical protein GHT06_022478 [Daphnia sinensis]|uniref:Serpin domain-containing protein n=1 Tax=Daphnia sinensis TaxID=1820382 RepID=A0AAD5KH42_9CRUS|nr:hypothetical protein GHT06_022478 [Daphnia sinensis]
MAYFNPFQLILFVLAINVNTAVPSSCTNQSSFSPALTKFSTSLYQATSKAAGKYDNVIVSPSSIALALAITLVGARGNTTKQIKQALHMMDETDATISCTIGAFNRHIKSNGITLKSMNRVLVSDDFRLTEAFRSTVRNQFDVIAENVNFSLPSTLESINAQIEKSTHGKIRDLIPSGSLGASTKMILTNAIYFKGNWLKAFDSSRSRMRPFYVGHQLKTMPTKMMASRSYFRTAFIKEADAQALELPYSGSQFSMIIILPNRYNGLPLVESLMSPRLLSLIDSKLSKTLIDVVIPKFKFESSPDLKRVLRSVGIIDLFNSDADLSGISGSKELYVSDAYHRAFIEVNEKGTEAAAVTAFRFVARSFRPTPFIPKFVADHPFLFIVRDRRSQEILFVGRFCKPERH